jgi:ligand-binding sensor domain-containing protein
LKTKQIQSYFTLFFLLLRSVFSPCLSQSQVIFSKINQTTGLSNDRVSSIGKDKKGFVWIGTKNGLNRFDGNNIKIYFK